MQPVFLKRAAFVGVALMIPFLGRADETQPTAEQLCEAWFGASVLRVTPMALAETNTIVSRVETGGQTLGWVFRTDQVPPVCKGKRGEISVLVGLGTDGCIKGLRVLAHKEDNRYFKRLSDAFFRQFVNLRAGSDDVGIDAVTRATFSSRAIIRDVTEGAKHVIALPEVAAQTKHSEDCPLTKTAAMSHN